MGMKQTIISTTGAISVTHDSTGYEDGEYLVGGLGAAETVTVKHYIGGTAHVAGAYDPAGATNNAAVFTGSGGTPANVNSMVLKGNLYLFEGADPAGTVTIEWIPGNKKHL